MSTTKSAKQSAPLALPANAFINYPNPPSEAALTAALGPTKAVWDRLIAELSDECDLSQQEWNSYSLKAGWSLRLKHEQRNIVYLCPCSGCFLASFALGDKAVQAARQGKLPLAVLEIISEAKRYSEGTAVRLQIESAQDISSVKTLAAVKLAN